MFGGPGAMLDADDEVKEICEGIQGKAEEALGEKYTEFKPVKYTKQIVNGTNYNIKVKVGGEKYVHIKVHVPLPNVNKPTTILEHAKDKTLADPL